MFHSEMSEGGGDWVRLEVTELFLFKETQLIDDGCLTIIESQGWRQDPGNLPNHPHLVPLLSSGKVFFSLTN